MAANDAVIKATANKMAAIAMFLNDSILEDHQGLSPSAVAALLVTSQSEELSIGAIADAVHLTHSAAVRLVDRLENDWLLRRRRRTGREVFVEITALGRRRAKELAEIRLKRSIDLIGGLSADQIEALNEILNATVVHQSNQNAANAKRLCRMCDRGICHCRGEAVAL